MVVIHIEAPSEVEAPGSGVQDIGLLIVEDQSQTRQSLAVRLRKEGYLVRVACHGARAVNLAAEPGINLILMDLDLPGRLDGLEAACQIRLAYPEKGILFVTGLYDRDEYRRRAVQMGLQDIEWVTKPSSQGQLTALLNTVLRMAQNMRNMKKQRIRQTLGSGTGDIPRSQVLEILQRWDPEVGAEVVRDILNEAAKARAALIAELRANMLRILVILVRNPQDVQELQMAFGPFKDKVLGGMWNLYEDADQNHQRVAIKLRSAVRKLCSLDFGEKHVSALRFVIDKLAQEIISEQEIWECERTLRHQNIETILELGQHREEMLRIYRQVSEEYEDEA